MFKHHQMSQLSLTGFSLKAFKFVIGFVNRILNFLCNILTETFRFDHFQYYFSVQKRLKNTRKWKVEKLRQ